MKDISVLESTAEPGGNIVEALLKVSVSAGTLRISPSAYSTNTVTSMFFWTLFPPRSKSPRSSVRYRSLRMSPERPDHHNNTWLFFRNVPPLPVSARGPLGSAMGPLWLDSPGMMTSGKPSLRVMATPLLKISGFSRRTCSMSPLSSCREMIRPVQTEGRK